MNFYDTIAEYYHDIFPLRQTQVDFVLKHSNNINAKSLLDIGCATGAFACAVSESFKNVTALDANQTMITIAKERCKNKGVDFKIGDMLFLDNIYEGEKFDIITCFGNTLVHFASEELQKTLDGIYKHLSENSSIFIAQILNYDYILDENISQLPLIENSKVKFERYYNLNYTRKICFNTTLNIKDDQSIISNSVWLYPVGRKKLDEMLRNAGFYEINYYSNYDNNLKSTNHLPLIIVAK